jgi:pyruvate dehydrogenase E1 component alpha subunit
MPKKSKKKLTDIQEFFIWKKAAYARAFEEVVFEKIKDGTVKIPAYLSAGQELISATVSEYYKKNCDEQPAVFIQHRGHSTYLSFGGDPQALVDELLCKKTGCSNGMGGSASIQSKEANIFGHDGLMGSHIPIAVGYCYATKKPTICFTGDAAGEEDYALAAYGWASTKNLPILFVVEDNGLSILTEKRVRRNWEIHDVASSMGVKTSNSSDDPHELNDCLNYLKPLQRPALINVETTRLFWHAGAGIDDPQAFDRLANIADKSKHKLLCSNFLDRQRANIRKLWESNDST